MKISEIINDLSYVMTQKQMSVLLKVSENTVTAWKLDPNIKLDHYKKLTQLHSENRLEINRIKRIMK